MSSCINDTTRPGSTRLRRRGKQTTVALVIVLAVFGAWKIFRGMTSPPGVGHFRTAEGRATYVEHYAEAMSLLPDPTAQHEIETDFGVVRVYEWSTPQTQDDTPVVLIPGRSSGVPMWQANLESFAASHRVLAFDALGDAGMSVQSAPMHSFEDQAAWIEQVLDELAPQGVHIVGHSFGGATATIYARLHPDRVRSLTLLEPVFTFAYPPPNMMWWATVASLPGMSQTVREHALGKVGGVDYERTDPMALMIESGTQHFAAELPTPSPLSTEEAAALTMPVYVAIAGRDSMAGGNGAAEHARELLPNSTVKIWPEATHSLPMQEAEPLAEFLDDFWRSAH